MVVIYAQLEKKKEKHPNLAFSSARIFFQESIK